MTMLIIRPNQEFQPKLISTFWQNPYFPISPCTPDLLIPPCPQHPKPALNIDKRELENDPSSLFESLPLNMNGLSSPLVH
jgi:hypothetical protein